MKKLVLVFATVIACVSAVNAQTQQQNGVLSGQKPLTPAQTQDSKTLNSTPAPATGTPTTPQSVTPTPSRTLPAGTPIGSPTQPGNPPSPNTTNPNMPQNPSDRNIK